jgi:catechol 2,3-dioxygenase-like lactoylglutathione lyase family enzyme
MQKHLEHNFTGLQHIGIPVTDLQQSVQFYMKLGFDNVMEGTFAHNNETGNVRMMKRGEAIVELFMMPESELAEIRNRKDGHIDHLAFNVVDIDKAYSELKNSGFQISEKEPVSLTFWKKGCKYFTVIGPDNEKLEFNQIL